MSEFDTSVRDSQGSDVRPIAPERFDLEAYAAYEAALLEANRAFQEAESGLLVYRRFRADGVFYDKCRDADESLALQLGALQASMAYKADVANFLEPWYGIGYIASSFGTDYIWLPDQAPNVAQPFASCEAILEVDPVPIQNTPIGKTILDMIERFLDKTRGQIPISFSDIQSPLNMLSYLLPTTELFMTAILDPDGLREAAKRVTDLLIDFLRIQRDLIGSCLARPGHGFASSRAFRGAGMSDDMSLMLSPADYLSLFAPHDERIGQAFDGVVYHSCGNWEAKIDMVKQLKGLIAVDGAFNIQTDPAPNTPAPFAEAFAGTGVVVNARAVGDLDEAFASFESLWKPGQKLIAVTYCKTPEEQVMLYDRLHAMARELAL